MEDRNKAIRLLLFDGFNERDRFEIKHKGWFSAEVEILGQHRYAVNFYDCTRLTQEVNDGVERGIPCLGEPGMIVVKEVTIETMEAALAYLFTAGYFEHLKPVS
ncbi:MAG: hypothetical protein DYG89_27080 [Caldilinea sp. CFX5]|nr:hypothetical protein [Caldilinea sp. CFX5]